MVLGSLLSLSISLIPHNIISVISVRLLLKDRLAVSLISEDNTSLLAISSSCRYPSIIDISWVVEGTLTIATGSCVAGGSWTIAAVFDSVAYLSVAIAFKDLMNSLLLSDS